jgi:hypothetical protein
MLGGSRVSSLQRRLDERYGEGVVVVSSALEAID